MMALVLDRWEEYGMAFYGRHHSLQSSQQLDVLYVVELIMYSVCLEISLPGR